MNRPLFSPYKRLGVALGLIFLLEAAVMVLINYLNLTPLMELFIDSAVLIFLALPVLYAIFIRPMIRQYQATEQANRTIQSMYDQLQHLTHKIVQFQEHERRFVAKTLYDEVGQTVYSTLLQVELLKGKGTSTKAFNAQAAGLEKDLDAILQSLHDLANDLRPASLDFLGLQAALMQHIDRLQEKYPPRIHFHAEGLAGRLPEATEIVLFRIAQEALMNAIQHAQAGSINVHLQEQENVLILLVEDDGAGFILSEVDAKECIGLLFMREQAEMVRGEFEIETAPGRGTTVWVAVPK